MTSNDFVFWLKGAIENKPQHKFFEYQVECIKRHLDLVFAHDVFDTPDERAFCYFLKGFFITNDFYPHKVDKFSLVEKQFKELFSEKYSSESYQFSPRQFCFYLQGYFEVIDNHGISVRLLSLLKSIAEKIQIKITDIGNSYPALPTNASEYCSWFLKKIQYAKFFYSNNEMYVETETTYVIKQNLNAIFLHDIDPKMGDAEHQAHLNAIHHANSHLDKNDYEDGEPRIRC